MSWRTGCSRRWIRSAAAVTKPRGGLAIIARPVSLAPILAALAGRFGSAEIMPVHARADTPAIRIVVTGKAGLARGARAEAAAHPA